MSPSHWTLNPQGFEGCPREAGVLKGLGLSSVLRNLVLTQGGLDLAGPAEGQGAGRERQAASPGSSRGAAGCVFFAAVLPSQSHHNKEQSDFLCIYGRKHVLPEML